ncbi:MAG: glycosyltransferase family 4 protein [Bacteroidia bacterium]|nr:glycosyltransferase family 4 protein [Bacteroidia bacterium]
MNQPTLLVVSPGFPANEQDSTCLPALRMFLKEELLREHFNIRVISMHYPFQAGQYTWFGLKVWALAGKNKKGLFRIPLYLKTWAALRKNRNKDGLTVVLSIFASEAALLASYFSKKNKLLHFCWVMGQDAGNNNPYHSMFSSQIHYLVMSEFLKQRLEQHGKRKAFGILPSALYVQDLPAFKTKKRNTDFVCVGSLIPLKRVEWVLQVVQDLKKENLNAKVCIIGDGPERQALETMSRKSGISEQVQFRGEIQHREVLNEMMQSKIVLHPSAYEGFGNVFLEALYSGCHVVSLFDPFNEKHPELHKVDSYPEFYSMARTLLLSQLDHRPVQTITSKSTAHSFIAFVKSAGNPE